MLLLAIRNLLPSLGSLGTSLDFSLQCFRFYVLFLLEDVTPQTGADKSNRTEDKSRTEAEETTRNRSKKSKQINNLNQRNM